MDDEDFFDLYFQYVEASSEAPFQYHRWALLTGLGSLLGRKVSMDFGFELIYPNLYCILLGPSASRKSSALRVMRQIISGAGFDKFAKDKSSKERFLIDLARGFGADRLSDEELQAALDEPFDDPNPKEVLVCASELEDFLGAKDSGFISLLTNLYDNLDQYENPKLSGPGAMVTKPTVGIVGGATATTFTTIFPPEAVGQGILSRTVIVGAEGPRCKITLPPPPPAEIGEFLVEHLRKVAQLQGTMRLNAGAYKMIDDIYQADFPIADGRLASYAGRRHIQLLKICMIYAALDLCLEIKPEHVLRANSVLHYAELLMPRALGEFGRSQNSGTANDIMSCLAGNKQGLDMKQLMARVSNNVKDVTELSQILKKLMDAGKVTVDTKTVRFKVASVIQLKVLPHIDFNLLREYDSKLVKTQLE